MQTICAYEVAYLTISDFCGLFTADEWAGFENTLDIACESNPIFTKRTKTSSLAS